MFIFRCVAFCGIVKFHFDFEACLTFYALWSPWSVGLLFLCVNILLRVCIFSMLKFYIAYSECYVYTVQVEKALSIPIHSTVMKVMARVFLCDEQKKMLCFSSLFTSERTEIRQ